MSCNRSASAAGEKKSPSLPDQKWLLLSLWLTQALIALLALGLLQLQGRLGWELVGFEGKVWLLGVIVGLCIVLVDMALTRWLPPDWLDDRGINRALFRNLPIPMIAAISLVVAVAEELLFRGALQHWLGVIGASTLFVLIHVRYLRKWVLLVMLFMISLTLGWMVEWTGTLAPAIAAHFTVDFVLGLLIRSSKVDK